LEEEDGGRKGMKKTWQYRQPSGKKRTEKGNERGGGRGGGRVRT